MNTATLQIAIEVDDRGSVKIRQLGRTVEETGRKGERSFRGMGRTLGDFVTRVGSAARTLGMLGSAATLGGLYTLNRTMTTAIRLAGEQEEAENRLQGALRATGNAAGYSLGELRQMAGAMQSVTTVGDEVILSGMAILATFKNVRGQAFERTTMVAMDMARVMGTDLNSAILQIGKAMNDPARNLSMLSRAGVTFTKTQSDMVKQLVETGHTMEAQEIILSELESEFGGAAKAARNNFTGAWTAAGNALGDLGEQIGFTITRNRDLVEIGGKVETMFNHWVEAAGRGREQAGELDGALDDLLASLDEAGQRFFEDLPSRINDTLNGIGDVIEDLGELKEHVAAVYSAVPAFIWEVGLVAAMFGGKKGRIAMASIVGLAEAKAFLDDLELFYSSEGVRQMLDLQRDMVTVHQDAGAAMSDLGPKIITMGESAETASGFVAALAEETGAARRASEDFDGQVPGWISDYDDLGQAWRSVGESAGESARTACEARKKNLSCAQKALQKEVDAAVAAGRQMKDLWQVQAEDKYKILSRSYQAEIDLQQATSDAVNADLEQLMTDRKELWQGGNDEIATLQENLVNDLGRTLDSYISDVLRGEIDTIGDLVEGLFNSILDMFARTLSQIAANSIIDAIFGAGASGAGGLTIQGLLGGGGGLLGTAASGASLASGASTVAGWLGMGGGSAAAAGGAAAVGGAGFGITQAGSAAAGYGATATGAITDFSIDAAGGSAGLAGGAGIGAALGTAAAIAAVPVALNLLGSLFDREHPAWDIPTSSGRNLQVTKVTDDPLADVHKALERTALSAGDAAMKVDRYTDALHDSEYASEYAEEAAADFQAQIDDAWRLVEYLGNDVGEAWAAAALRIDGSITSIDTFVDTAAGFDVAMTTSASMWDLATQAARGNAEALGALEGKFRDLGLGAAAADQATMAMVGAVNKLSHTSLDMEATAKLNVEVHGDASASASVTGSSSVSSGDFGWWRHAGDHALGAIFTAPTLLAGPDGLHRVAEAGMAEAVLPLPAGPRTMQLVLDSLEALLARQAAPGRIEVHVNLAGEKVGQVLLPMIDRYIDARQSRGVSGRVVYAAG